MYQKPIKPTLHALNDYAFSGVLLAAPRYLGMHKKAAQTYSMLGTGFLVVTALTDTDAGIKKVFSFKAHQRADLFFLASLSLLALTPAIRKDKKALSFHLAFLATAVAHYALTDYKAGSQTSAPF